MRWGTEVWDRFEDVSNYVYKGIEFCERYEEFWKKRSSIENTYAKNLRKLIESFEPKKKENTEENNSTHLKCFMRMLSELRDVAGQHELIAENVNEKVLIKLNQIIKVLKEERKKCIDDKDRFHLEHLAYDEQLEKCKQKYDRAYRDVEKAEDLLVKVENDDSASKNDIKKQKIICEQKKRILDTLEAEYAKQLCEANRVKNCFYYEQLPSVFDSLQNLEKTRIENFKELVCQCVNVEVEVLPRIRQCLDEINISAKDINSEQDTEMVIKLFKTGYTIPNDHVFENLNEKSFNSNINGSIISNNHLTNTNGYKNGSMTLGGHASTNSLNNTLNGTNTVSLNHNPIVGALNGTQTSRQKKYRTLNRIKGLFIASGSKNEQNNNGIEASMYDLPPQQLKNELLKKISSVECDLEKHQKEREGLLKLKDIYSKNQKFGDSQSADQALKSNEERLINLNNQLRKYQEIFSQVEFTINNNATLNQQKQMQYSSGEYSSSSVHSSGCGAGGSGAGGSSSSNGSTMSKNTTNSNQQSQYQIYHSSPSKQSSSQNGQSLPNTPLSNHINQNGNNNNNQTSNSNTVAYAISPVSQINHMNGTTNGTKKAPIVNSNTNESFDDNDDLGGDDDDSDNDEDDEGGNCYESPTAHLKINNKLNRSINAINGAGVSSFIEKNNNFESSQSQINTSTNGNKINGFPEVAQYDQVDTNLYEQTMSAINDNNAAAAAAASQYNQYDDNELIIGTALVIYSFAGTVQNAMSIEENESLNVLERDSGDGWTLVKRLNGEKGYVPTDYIRIVYY